MDEMLISKKDLLDLTGISYGQLYRWKRKGLIPEDWFIRKATYTGQETFFPRSQVLARVEKIKHMKEDISLDDLADVFSPAPDELSLTAEQAAKRGVASSEVLKIYFADRGGEHPLDFAEALQAHIFDTVLVSGEVSLDEARLMLDVLRTASIRQGEAPAELYLTRKLGVFCCFTVSPSGEVCLDRDMRLIRRIHLPSVTEALKLKLV
jgi:DNA-binding transcriptional MerR regulator